MPRIVFIALFLLAAALPIVFFAALARDESQTSSGSTYRGSSYHRRGYLFVDLDYDSAYRGRGYSSGSFQGGGSHAGK